MGKRGGREGWRGVEVGDYVLRANINNGSQEGEETPRVKVRRNPMIGSFRSHYGFPNTSLMIG